MENTLKNLFSKHNQLKFKYDKLSARSKKILKSDISYFIKFLSDNKIDSTWYPLFWSVYLNLIDVLKKIELERKDKVIYPPQNLVFKVFEKNINDVKIIFLGQDPYIRKNQAMGLSFSVPDNIMMPPSLYNIFKEIKTEFPERKYIFKHGNLTKWFDNGMFLLNSALTVLEGSSNEHQYIWSWFTDEVIKYIDKNMNGIVYLLLGGPAKSKQIFIKNKNNKIITGVHPSPLSASKGFFNSGIFKKIENELGKPFDWSI